jgi:hypothetical protein
MGMNICAAIGSTGNLAHVRSRGTLFRWYILLCVCFFFFFARNVRKNETYSDFQHNCSKDIDYETGVPQHDLETKQESVQDTRDPNVKMKGQNHVALHFK